MKIIKPFWWNCIEKYTPSVTSAETQLRTNESEIVGLMATAEIIRAQLVDLRAQDEINQIHLVTYEYNKILDSIESLFPANLKRTSSNIRILMAELFWPVISLKD